MSNGAFTTGIRRKKVGALIALVAAPAVAAASDGVIEINQASALAGGVTASDAPGFPVTLTSSGSFVLTGDLVLPDANTTGIVVLADDVRIDLAGFSIRGVVSCAPAADAVVCTPAGTGIGIESQSELTRVRDGVVRGMGGDGIRVADAARVEDVIVSDNGGNGIETGLFALIRDVLAQRNGARGIELGGSSRVVGAQAFLNGNCGVRGGTNVMLERVQASANQVCGVLATDVTLIESSASGNSGMGVVIDASAVLRGNQVIGNTSNGISTLAGAPGLPGTEAVIEGNVIRASGFRRHSGRDRRRHREQRRDGQWDHRRIVRCPRERCRRMCRRTERPQSQRKPRSQRLLRDRVYE